MEQIINSRARVDECTHLRDQSAMLDFCDFNVHHAPSMQAYVFRSISQAYSEVGASEDLSTIAAQCALCMANQYVRFPGKASTNPESRCPLQAEGRYRIDEPRPEFYHRVTQGMFSGIRSTNFLNTVLNRAYYRACRLHVERFLYPHIPSRGSTVHQGDDIWWRCPSRNFCASVYRMMQHCGFRFQPEKQIFGDSAEFLRVQYRPTGAHGFVCRVVATLIVKPLQGQTQIVIDMLPLEFYRLDMESH